MFAVGEFMNVEHINPFVQSAQAMIATVCADNAAMGKMFVKAAPYKCMGVAVTAGVSGDVSGFVVYTMEKPTAMGIASKMMGGMAVAALDEISSSALAELTNMISGSAASAFAGKSMKVSVSAPAFAQDPTDANFPFIKPDSKILCIPLTLSGGAVFEIDVLFA